MITDADGCRELRLPLHGAGHARARR